VSQLPSRALHVLKRLCGATAVAVALAAGDAAVGTAALAASPAAAASLAAPRASTGKAKTPRAKRDARSSRKQSASSRSRRTSSRSTTRKSTAKRPFARTARASLAPKRRATVATVPEVPAFVLPDLASLFPGDSSLRQHGAALAATAERPFTAIGRSASALLDQMVARARSQLGTRYVLGGADPGAALDCSSFARYAMEALGIKLPRTAAQQAQVGTPVARDRSQLRAGDLLTFGLGRKVSHVGIYLGEGRFIHASVKSGQVIETTFERNGLLLRRWQGARRLIASNDSTAQAGG
jgi:cell wall-associated NlpC family hydrolase